jgi:CheY-like chemotaxis protein
MPPKILIVDDDRHTRRVLETLIARDPELAPLQLKVLAADDGLAGLELFEAERPSVIVTDLLMPRMDGFAFCGAVRSREYGQKVALLAMSALYKDPTLIEKMRSELRVEFFAKPFQVRELLQAVRRHLQSESGAGAEAKGRCSIGACRRFCSIISRPARRAH